MAFLAGYDTVASYVTFIVNEDRFPCYDGKGADYIPDPIISADAFNRSLRFSTRKPGFVDVDIRRIRMIPYGGIRKRMAHNTYRFPHISIAISGVGRLR